MAMVTVPTAKAPILLMETEKHPQQKQKQQVVRKPFPPLKLHKNNIYLIKNFWCILFKNAPKIVYNYTSNF